MTQEDLTSILPESSESIACRHLSDVNDLGLVEAIGKALEAGVFEECSEDGVEFVMKCFTVPKSNGTRRLIYDARPLNLLCEPAPHFELETLPVIQQSCEPGTVCGSIDLKSAFWQIGLNEQSRRFFGLQLSDGRTYRWRALPFGFFGRPLFSVRSFTELSKNVGVNAPMSRFIPTWMTY